MEPEPTVTASLDREAVRLLLQSVQIALERWPGGDPQEQESLRGIRDSLFRMQLEFSVAPEN